MRVLNNEVTETAVKFTGGFVGALAGGLGAKVGITAATGGNFIAGAAGGIVGSFIGGKIGKDLAFWGLKATNAMFEQALGKKDSKSKSFLDNKKNTKSQNIALPHVVPRAAPAA